MKNSINLKVVGYVPVMVCNGKIKVLSNQIMTKDEAKNYTISKVVKQNLSIISHALNLETLRADFLRALENIKAARKLRSLKGFFNLSVQYFRAACAKLKLFKYINSLTRDTKVFLNEFMEYSDLFNFSLYRLNLR